MDVGHLIHELRIPSHRPTDGTVDGSLLKSVYAPSVDRLAYEALNEHILAKVDSL